MSKYLLLIFCILSFSKSNHIVIYSLPHLFNNWINIWQDKCGQGEIRADLYEEHKNCRARERGKSSGAMSLSRQGMMESTALVQD